MEFSGDSLYCTIVGKSQRCFRSMRGQLVKYSHGRSVETVMGDQLRAIIFLRGGPSENI